MSAQPHEGRVADSGAAGLAAALAVPPVDDGAAAGKSMIRPTATTTTTTTLLPSSQQGQQQGKQQQQTRHKVAIVWFRRDLRVSDNPALMAAAAEADFVVRRSFGQNGGFARQIARSRSFDFFFL